MKCVERRLLEKELRQEGGSRKVSVAIKKLEGNS